MVVPVTPLNSEVKRPALLLDSKALYSKRKATLGGVKAAPLDALFWMVQLAI